MRLRTVLLLGVVLLIAGLLAATMGVVAAVVRGAAFHEITGDLERAREAFALIKAQRDARHLSEARVVAEEPRLKAVVATEDVSHETIVGVAHELRKALQSDLFLLTDREGLLLADVLDPKATGFDLGAAPLVASALSTGEAAGTWTTGGHAYEVSARRLAFGETTVGVLVTGYQLGDAVAESVGRQMGCGVAVQHDGRLVAASPLEDGAPQSRDELAAALAAVPTTGPGASATEVLVGGARFLALAGPLPGPPADGALRFVVLRSLDHVLAPATRAARLLYLIAAGALAVATIAGLALSRRLTRPLDALVALTQRIAAGDLDARAELTGPLEVRALGEALHRMADEITESRRQLVAKERLEKELEISSRIQTSILPRAIDVDGLEIAAMMIPAAEVGGDYYDVLPVRGSTWIGVGDVAGHGLSCGMIMLMLQSIVSALVHERPQAAPSEILRASNRVLHENIRQRLGNDEHVTMTLLRYRRDGVIFFAGAHEEIVVYRAATGRCELVPTPGPWLGAISDIDHVTVDSRLELEDGDVVLLYTDGITEARDASGAMFGLEPLTQMLEALHDEPVEHIRDEILRAVLGWAPEPEDDLTLLVLRYSAPQSRIA